jgi:hypothetical protein
MGLFGNDLTPTHYEGEIMTTIELKIKTPSVPNYVHIEQPPGLKQEGFKEVPGIAICDLTDAQLESLADDWKRALLANAKRQRELRSKD